MNIWRFAFKEIKTLRDIKVIIYLLGTPIILILILGTVLSNVFNGSIAVGDIRVLYKNMDPESEISGYWEAFVEKADPSVIRLEQAGESMDGIREVENNQYVGYVEISETGMKYYGNSQSSVESGIAQSLLAVFADRYNLAAAIAEANSGQAGEGVPIYDGANYVQVFSLDGDRQPSAMDYYAIAMLTLIIMFGALGGADLIEGERRRKTAVRLTAAPVSKAEIFAGKVVGMVLLNMLSTVVVVFLCKYMFGVYWGDRLWLVLLVLFTQTVFAVSLGFGLSYLLKGKAASAVVMIIIQVGAFIGGSYFPVTDTTGWLRTITKLSPLEWSNSGLLQVVFSQGWSEAGSAMLLNIGFSVVLLGAAAIIMRRREGL